MKHSEKCSTKISAKVDLTNQSIKQYLIIERDI